MKTGNPNNFILEKHYLDFLDERGNCFIIYQAKFQLFFIKINYSSLIYSDLYGNIIEQSSLKKKGYTDSDDILSLHDDNLNISGHWTRIDKSLPPYLFIDCNNRKLSWNCHHPKTMTQIEFNGNLFRGFGYAETLTTTIKPVRLPMNEILWGRYHAVGQTIVWICWKGKHPLNKLYFNGEEFSDTNFEGDRITFSKNRYSLIFLYPEVVRRGKLSSLFEEMKWIKIFFGRSVMSSVENKFKSRTSLELDNNLISTGWSLYEQVTWKSTENLQQKSYTDYSLQ